MNAIKNIISNCSIVELNLSSNLISKSGLELIADDLIRNTLIKSIDVIILNKYIVRSGRK